MNPFRNPVLAARKQLDGAQSDKDKDFYTNRCDGLDRSPSSAGMIGFQPSVFGLQHCLFDALVYDLYALTPAEIKIVEGVTT